MINIPSEHYQAWENTALHHILKYKKLYKVPIEGPIEAHFEFYFLNHQAEPDTSNCIEGPQDAMAKVGIFNNDKQIVRLRAAKFFGVEPKTIIRLYSST